MLAPVTSVLLLTLLSATHRKHKELLFLLNKKPVALIIQIYSVIKLYICFRHLLCPSSGIFYCTFGTGKCHACFWWPLRNRVRMELLWLCLEAVIKNLHEAYQCRTYSRKLL